MKDRQQFYLTLILIATGCLLIVEVLVRLAHLLIAG